uniref:Uncharacterized protein n=1 Tax=Daucus carota subsp. sativus TaxID=79200 RepID=A0A175YHM4_DAUCS
MASFSKQEKGRLRNRGNHRSQDNPTRVRSGNQQDGATNKPPSGNEASSETNDKLRVLQHWFLLESDWVDAINKGNHSLIPAALARVDLLCTVVCPDLLKEGLKGEEEALWSIHESLYNNGWWERARNLDLGRKNWSKKDAHSDLLLNNFMSSYERFVDPNVQLMVKQGSQEGFRMALNHIHYGSIRESRENGMRNNHSSSSVSQHQAPAKHTSQVTPRTYAFMTSSLPVANPSPVPLVEEEQSIPFHTSNWKPRDNNSSISVIQSGSVEEDSTVDDAIEEAADSLGEIQQKIIMDMEKLKGLSEAESIFETGVLMGLLPLDSKEKSLELIALNLKA